MRQRDAVRRRGAELARLNLSANLRAVSVAEGVRAALSVAVIMAANEYLAWPPLGEAALAALLTCICDPGGPIRRRVPVLLSFTLIGALIVAGVGLARGLGIAVALPIGVFGLFCTSFARIYGPAPQQLGALLGVVLILALDRALPDLATAATQAGCFIGGGLWATLLTLVIWRVHPFLPARRAVAEVYRSLALLAENLRGQLHSADAMAWDAHARTQRGAVRTAIEIARTAVMDTLRARGPATPRSMQSLIRLEAAEQMFGALIALSDLMEHGSGVERRTADRLLRRLQPLLRLLARAIVADDGVANQRVGRAIDVMTADLRTLQADDPLWPIVECILERLRVAHTLTVPENLPPGVGPAGERPTLRQRLRGPLLASLNPRSPALRHAVRIALVAAPALAFTMLWFTPFDHWLTITIVATMQPYYALTYARALERVIGTAAGGLLAAVVGLVCTTPLAIAVAMFPLAVLALGLRAVSLGFFMLGLTPLIVLLVESGEPQTSEWLIAGARALLTLVGGVVAVGANLLVWPSRAAEGLAEELRSAIAAHGRFAVAELAHLLGEADAASVDAARRAAGLASNSMEASISRALLEPGQAQHGRLDAALVVDAALRRYAGRIAALPFDRDLARIVPPPAMRLWQGWIDDAMRRLAAGETSLPPRPAVPGSDALMRIARQVELMAGALERLTRQPEA